MQTILIVEDDEDISRALTIRLEAEGFEVHHAFDAVLAMAAVRKWEPDFVLMDFTVPGGTGVDVAQRMRDCEEAQDIPIVFLTANKAPEVRAQIEAMGFPCFEKPYNSQQLLAFIQSVLGPDPSLA